MKRKWGNANLRKRTRHIIATAAAFTFLCQNLAWAVCADGSTFPANGFVAGQPPAANWSSNGGFRGSIFIPDNSVFEHNNPAEPLTGGGHNWVFDTLCKAIDTGPAGGTPTAWQIPPFPPPNQQDCVLLPSIKNVFGNPPIPVFGAFTESALQGDAITPTCDPTQYVGGNPLVGPALPTNTYFNHLGCSISHGAATTPQTALTWFFVISSTGDLFVVPLSNNVPAVSGGSAGKIVTGIDWYSNIPLGQKLTNAAVSPDGQFAIATSFINNSQTVFGCLNPLGDPTGTNPATGVQSFPITGGINPGFSLPVNPNSINSSNVPPTAAITAPCMQVGTNGLAIDETAIFGPDDQPYFGGAANPGSPSVTSFSGWPQCTFNGFSFPNPAPTTLIGQLAVVFNARSANHCGTIPSFFSQTPIGALIKHGSYIYAGTWGGQVLQFKTISFPDVLSSFPVRSYIAGLGTLSIVSLSVSDDLKSLMIVSGTNGFIKLPLCEDM
jgi:hypothetical protein